MNKTARAGITSLLQDAVEPWVLEEDILVIVGARKGIPHSDLRRELELMRDDGFTVSARTPLHWRLTSPGEKASAPLPNKSMEWISTHWLALFALVVSIVALFKR